MQKWDEINDRPVGAHWTPDELRHFFQAIMGGVSLPGKRPGHCVIVALRPIKSHTQQHVELHVLSEAQDWNIKGLLRTCHSLGKAFNRSIRRDFEWFGDSTHEAIRDIVAAINDGVRPDPAYASRTNELTLWRSSLLDIDRPYSLMASELGDLLRQDSKQLWLHRSQVAGSLSELKPDELGDLPWGSYPAIESLSFAVRALVDHADEVRAEMAHRRDEQRFGYSDQEPERHDVFRFLKT